MYAKTKNKAPRNLDVLVDSQPRRLVFDKMVCLHGRGNRTWCVGVFKVVLYTAVFHSCYMVMTVIRDVQEYSTTTVVLPTVVFSTREYPTIPVMVLGRNIGSQGREFVRCAVQCLVRIPHNQA
jgi:hypothetical protein